MRKLYLLLCLLFATPTLWAQTTETFETEANGATSFTDNGQVFNITSQAQGPFYIQGNYPGTGWNGTAADNKYIDNSGNATFNVPVQFTVSSADAAVFTLESMYLFLSTSNLTFAITGSCTITGKLGGVTQYTATSSSGFTNSFGVNNGFTFINMATYGGANNAATTIDQFVVTTTGNIAYVSLDTMRWKTAACAAVTVTPAAQTNIACFGGSNGSASVTASGGTGLTYNWTPGNPTGDGTASVTGLTAGTWTCTVTNACGNSNSTSFNITQPAAVVSGTTVVTNVSCFGGSNGSINLTPSGGAGGYTFNWGGGITTEDRTGLAAGTYTVTITDANGCTGTVSATVTQPAAAVSGTTVVTNVSCFGGTNGSINLTPSGGAGGYTFNWGGGITTEDRTGLAAGTYTVTITDANGCTGTVSATVTQPAAVVSGTTVVTNVSCFGGTNGSINLTPSGGAGGYTFNWGGGITTEDRTGLAAGTYTVTITDANGCTGTVSATVTQAASAVSGTTVVTNVSCFGGTNGSINLTPSGGAGGYTFNWGGGITTEDRTGLAAGTYTVTITDANGCTGTVSATVTQPAAVVSGTTVVTNVSCFGGSNGSINLTPSGGAGGYTYNWGGGITTEDRTGLAAGTYTVTITDANGCTGTVSATVTQPASAVSGTTVVTNVSCFGGTNGSINLTPSGGAGGYTFNWGGGITTEDRTGLAAGTYTVTITDANGCTGTVSATVTQPAAAISLATGSKTDVSCFGGSNGTATVSPTGGTPGYSYSWAPSGGTGATASGLTSGTYTVTVTDANSCQTTRTFTVNQPAALIATSSQTNVSCNGGSNGSASVAVTGGTGTYTYSWAPSGGTGATASGLSAGTYTVTITDANTCSATQSFTITQPAALVATSSQTNVSCNGGSNGSASVAVTGGTGTYTYSWAPSGGTAATASGLSSGTYTVTITDANTCSATQSFTITQPAALVATSSQTNVSCNGGTNGSASVAVTGGTGTYTYSWAPSGGTAATATGLSSGTYTVTVTDANSCTTTQSFTITQPAALAATPSQTNVSCNGGSNGSATVAVTGGTGTYTYSWAPSGSTAATASGLSSGTYTVTITDANTCSATQSFTITQPAALVATSSQTNVSCNGGTNGSASVAVTGGTGTYTYVWSPSGGTAATASGLSSGTYTVTITDANSCTATQSFTITQPAAIIISTQPQDEATTTGGTATFTVAATNATTYQWQVSTNGGTSWANVADGGTDPAYSGAQTATLTLTGIPASASGYLYQVIVSAGVCTLTSANAELTVNNALTAADDDFSTVSIVAGTGGNAGDVTTNDLLNGAAVSDAALTITITDNDGMAGAAIDANGILSVPVTATQGTYEIVYSICEVANPTNCSSATATVVVLPELKTIGFPAASVSIYPNPATANVSVAISGIAAFNKVELHIYDLNGRKITVQALTAETTMVDMSGFAAAVYVFQITSDEGIVTKQVVKQ